MTGLVKSCLVCFLFFFLRIDTVPNLGRQGGGLKVECGKRCIIKENKDDIIFLSGLNQRTVEGQRSKQQDLRAHL